MPMNITSIYKETMSAIKKKERKKNWELSVSSINIIIPNPNLCNDNR